MAIAFVSKETERLISACSRIENKRLEIDGLPAAQKREAFRGLLSLIQSLNVMVVREMATLEASEVISNIKEV